MKFFNEVIYVNLLDSIRSLTLLEGNKTHENRNKYRQKANSVN